MNPMVVQKSDSGLLDKIKSQSSSYVRLNNALHILKTNINMHSIREPFRSIMITSPFVETDRFFVAKKLAGKFAGDNHNVLLIQLGDDLKSSKGLSNLIDRFTTKEICEALEGLTIDPQKKLEDGHVIAKCLSNFLMKTDQNFFYLSQGTKKMNLSDQTRFKAIQALLSVLNKQFDEIIFCLPPLETDTNVRILASLLDQALLVVDEENKRHKNVKRSIKALRKIPGKLMGTILFCDASKFGVHPE